MSPIDTFPQTSSTEEVQAPAKDTQVSQRFEQALELTVAGLQESLHQYMPAGVYRDFSLWAFSPANPYGEFYLQAVGITQLVKLTLTLLDDLVDEDRWPELLLHTVPMNVYQVYEIISDNLAIGLARPLETDRTHAQRRTLLYEFNQAMMKRLNGAPRPASQLLAALQPVAQRISLFDQSLIATRHRMLAWAYMEQQAGHTLEEIEHALWPTLVANIESCVELARCVDTCQLGHLVREGLVRRYDAVNCLVQGKTYALPRLAEISAYAILVIPTLAYYAAVLGEIVVPHERFHMVVEDGSLAEALYDAALLVRLLNDLGTGLVTLSPDEEKAFLHRVRVHATRASGWKCSSTPQAIADTLQDLADESGLLTRIRKDLTFGEYNVGLYALDRAHSMPDVLWTLSRNLECLTQLYAHHHTHLLETLSQMYERTGDERVSELVFRFVRFHEILYSHAYDTRDGEYAI